MKADTLIFILILATAVLYPVMCWAHRDAGTALLVTIFTPLVAIPMGGLVWLVVGGVLKGFNVFLEYGNIDLSDTTIMKIAWIVTGIAAFVALVFYARDQRHLSLIKTGPRWGGAAPPSRAVFNQKTRLR